ncbi:hypothetical protein [Azospirillum brasilense]|uniref:hypothetical protein n=1 Tax=Azospirillum brasilense TaxID=192 RepID=UPI000E6A78E8|nr:hypothetical protein [Azospirillum brasilense]NUB24320.1 hypothetical protein [Azospirillum brasilense]NUB34108.1 hypothetical protein [Azospirillum brasilense]RIW01002.1 hypothetical protein D2T81_19525 [Azospirillum brasilense]
MMEEATIPTVIPTARVSVHGVPFVLAQIGEAAATATYAADPDVADEGWLSVPGTTTEALAAAVATYDPDHVPPAPEPVPEVISDRQFFQQLALDGYITPAEALAAVRTGDLPPVLADLIAHMDEAERFGAEMLLSGATEFRRDHPMTAVIGEARGLTPDEVDDFFRRAAAL